MTSSISSNGVNYYYNLFSGGLTSSSQSSDFSNIFNTAYSVNSKYQAKDIKVCAIPTGINMLFSSLCGMSIIENFFSGKNGDFATPDEMKARRISYYS